MRASDIARLLQGRSSGRGRWKARCPSHQDRMASLSIGHGDKAVLIKCFAGCSVEEILATVGLRLSDLWYDKTPDNLRMKSVETKCNVISNQRPKQRRVSADRKVVKVYDYTDEAGSLLYQKVRYQPKDFIQRQPDGHGGWHYHLRGVERVLYRLPIVKRARTVAIVEGEKDADNLQAFLKGVKGFAVTTNVDGAGKWRGEYAPHFAGKRVVIIPDNDPIGCQHAEQVAASVSTYAEKTKILALEGLPVKGDVTDWLELGHSPQEFLELLQATPLWGS